MARCMPDPIKDFATTRWTVETLDRGDGREQPSHLLWPFVF